MKFIVRIEERDLQDNSVLREKHERIMASNEKDAIIIGHRVVDQFNKNERYNKRYIFSKVFPIVST